MYWKRQCELFIIQHDRNTVTNNQFIETFFVHKNAFQIKSVGKVLQQDESTNVFRGTRVIFMTILWSFSNPCIASLSYRNKIMEGVKNSEWPICPIKCGSRDWLETRSGTLRSQCYVTPVSIPTGESPGSRPRWSPRGKHWSFSSRRAASPCVTVQFTRIKTRGTTV